MKEQENKKAPFFSKRYIVYDFIRIFGLLPGIIWFRPKFVYESKAAKKRIRGGALVISNHLGFYDPVYLFFAIWYRRQHFVCKKEFFEGKSKTLFKWFCCIPIDTQNPGVKSFKEIVSHLKLNKVVTIFPEGHVNDGSGQMDQFKSGMVLMALQSGKPIVPVYVKEKKHFYNRLVFVIGEPVNVASDDGGRPDLKRIEEITRALRGKEDELAALLNK